MYFIIGLIIFTTLVIGMNFCFLLIGGTPFHKGPEFAPVRMGGRTYTVERFAVGVSTIVFGAVWLVAWSYFLITGWNPFLAQFSTLIWHVAFQFAASIALIFSGIGIFRQWKKSNGVFWVGISTLVGSVMFSIIVYGPRGHGDPVFMYLFAVWTLVVGGFLTAATYLLDRLVHVWDERIIVKGQFEKPA